MNVNQISYIPDLKPDNSYYKASKTSNDKKSFKDVLTDNRESNKGIDEKAKTLKNNDTETQKSVKETNKAKDKSVKADEFENNSKDNSNSIDTTKEKEESNFQGNKPEKVKEEVSSVLSSLMNLLNAIKEQFSTTSGESKEQVSSELNTIVSKLLQGEISITDVLKDKNISSDVKEVLKNSDFNKLFTEKDNKLSQEIMKLFNSELSNETSGTDSKVLVENLISKVSEILNEASESRLVKGTEKTQSLVDKLTTLIDEKLGTLQDKPKVETENLSLTKNQNEKSDFDVLEQKTQYRNVKESNLNTANSTSENKIFTKKPETTAKEDKFLNSIINDGSKEESTNPKVVQFTTINNTTAANDVSKETPVVSKNTVVQDIIKTFKYMEDSNLKELTVKIKPKELGEITIKLITQGEIMKASINTSNKETYDLLNSKVPEIKHALNTQNIKIEDVSIDFNDSFQSFQSGEGNFSREQRNNSQSTTNYTPNDVLEDDLEEELGVLNNLNILA